MISLKEDAGLVILDVQMPTLSGLDLLKAIMDIDSSAAVLMLSLDSDISKIVDCIKLGAFDYIHKSSNSIGPELKLRIISFSRFTIFLSGIYWFRIFIKIFWLILAKNFWISHFKTQQVLVLFLEII